MDINGRCFQRVVVGDVDNEYYSGDVTHVLLGSSAIWFSVLI